MINPGGPHGGEFYTKDWDTIDPSTVPCLSVEFTIAGMNRVTILFIAIYRGCA